MSATSHLFGRVERAIHLSCVAPTPANAPCYWSPATVNVSADSSVAADLEIDTEVIYHFKSAIENAPSHLPATPLLAFLPLSAISPLGLRRICRKLASALAMLLCFFAATTLFTGRGDKYPASTLVGSYTIHVMANPVGNNSLPSRTAAFTLVVKP